VYPRPEMYTERERERERERETENYLKSLRSLEFFSLYREREKERARTKLNTKLSRT